MSMSPLTAALLLPTRSLWEQAHACIQNLPVRIALEQNEPGDPDALLDRIERHSVDVVLMEAKGLALPLDEFIRRVQDTASQPAVFVLHPEASPQHILEAMRAGSREFLYPPLTGTLRDAFENLAAARARSPSSNSAGPGRIAGFLSAKGGCGATTFACNIAAESARRLGRKVLLADFDMEAGLVRFLMKSKTTWSVRDALDNLHRMDASYWEALISKHQHGLDVIPSPDDIAARRPADAQEIAHLMRFMRSVYPLTVIDFGRHVSAAVLDSLPEIETLYLLAGVDIDTLDHARDCIAAVEARGFDRARIQVLVNRLPERGVPDADGIAAFLGMTPAGFFSTDHVALYDAWSEGRMLPANTRLGKELYNLAARIVAEVKGEPAEGKVRPPQVAPAGFRRFFSFMQKSHA